MILRGSELEAKSPKLNDVRIFDETYVPKVADATSSGCVLSLIGPTVFYKSFIMEFGEAIKNPAYRILQTEYSGCLDISAHA